MSVVAGLVDAVVNRAIMAAALLVVVMALAVLFPRGR